VRPVADTWLEGWVLTAVLYAGLLGWVFLGPAPARASRRAPPTRIRVVAPPEAKPPPAPAPPPPPAARPRLMEAVRQRRSALSPAPLLETPAAAPSPAPAPPRRFSVSMEATVPGGGVAVPVTGPGVPPSPRGVPGATGEGPDAPPFALEPDTGPGLVSQPSPEEMRALYPEQARRAALEGDVKLELVVSETGEVTEVRVVRSAGSGFDEAAERLVRRFRFRPAVRAGKPVPARIPWTYKFRLEG